MNRERANNNKVGNPLRGDIRTLFFDLAFGLALARNFSASNVPLIKLGRYFKILNYISLKEHMTIYLKNNNTG
jgi:hypothetical protein